MAWMGRKNKTYQDRIPAAERDRSREWNRLRSWSMEHKPYCSADWNLFRKAK